MNAWHIIGAILATGGICTLIGAAIGYYMAASETTKNDKGAQR